MPRWLIGWDVFCWIGHRRIARHWSVPQIRAELLDSYQIDLSEDALEDYLQRYQQMLAARQQDPVVLRREYHRTRHVLLGIDGLQPEKGHETLYVVRELGRKRVWFAESLISSSALEVRTLLAQARQWAERLGKPVRLWMSDKQDAFVTGIAAEFPHVPHRYCRNHFLRALAQPVLAMDSNAKVRLRRRVRGLRAIERAVLEQRRPDPAAPPTSSSPRIAQPRAEVGEVVLDYCTAVRGILNDGQGGPFILPVCAWLRRCAKSDSPWNAISKRKKGPCGSATPTACPGHRQRIGAGQTGAETDWELSQGPAGGGRHARSCERLLRPTSAPLPPTPPAICRTQGSDRHPSRQGDG